MQFIRSLRPLQRYNMLLHKHPTLTMASTSGFTMGLGNIICQVIADKHDLSTIDYVRVARYASFGFFVSGPIGRFWLYNLDLKIFKNRNIKFRALKMMLVDQTIMPWLLNSLFLIYINYLHTKSLTKSIKITEESIVPIAIESYKIWPLLTLLNFYFVPLQHRVLFGNVASVFWNAYFSYLVSK